MIGALMKSTSSYRLKSDIQKRAMVGLRNSVQNERYVSGIFDNEEKL